MTYCLDLYNEHQNAYFYVLKQITNQSKKYKKIEIIKEFRGIILWKIIL